MSSTCNILPWLRTDRIDLAEPKLRMDPAEAIDKMLPADPTESMQPADPSDMIEPTENTDWIEPVEQNERMDLVENSDFADSYPAAASFSLAMPSPRLRLLGTHGVDRRDVPSFVDAPAEHPPHDDRVNVQHGAPEADRVGRVGHDQLVAVGRE